MSDAGTPTVSPPRPSLLRRAWVAWTVAAVVTVAGGIGAGWMIRERGSAADTLAGVREELATASARADRLADRFAPLSARGDELRDELRRCTQEQDDRISDYTKLSNEYGDLEFLPEGEEASGLHDRFVALRNEAQTVLRRCRAAAAGSDQA